jgi:hypothetical protein
MLFLVWTGAQYRATKDLDLLALQSASEDRLREVFRELCQQPVAPDGLVFDADSVQAEDIREDSLYHGVRVTLLARLGNARIPIQVDIGFGDVVTPGTKMPVQRVDNAEDLAALLRFLERATR